MKLKIFLSFCFFIMTGIPAVLDILSLPRKWDEIGSDFNRWTELFENWRWSNYVLLAAALLSLIYVIYGICSWYLVTKKSNQELPKQFPNSLQAIDRVFTQETASEIFKDLDNLVSIKEKQRAKFYFGKWLRVQRKIDNISQFGANVTVSFYGKGFSDRFVNMEFSDENTCARLKTLDKGARLAVIGKIRDASSTTIHLIDCELVEFSPRDDKLK